MPNPALMIESARIKAELAVGEMDRYNRRTAAIHEQAEAMKDLAAAIREHTAAMFPPKEPEPEYRCANCGSPKWAAPGGMADRFKKCSDCGAVGDPIE